MLTKHEFRACQVLLSAARRGADFDETKSELRSLGVLEQSCRELYERLGLKVLINGSGDDAERYVYAPGNLLPPRSVTYGLQSRSVAATGAPRDRYRRGSV